MKNLLKPFDDKNPYPFREHVNKILRGWIGTIVMVISAGIMLIAWLLM